MDIVIDGKVVHIVKENIYEDLLANDMPIKKKEEKITNDETTGNN